MRQGNFLTVVADNEWAAIKAAKTLKATWSRWEGLPEQARLFDHVRATKVFKDDETSKVGDSAEALAQGAKKISATYDFAIHTHGSIGPSCAVAEFKDGKLTCWSASQATHDLRKQLAEMLALPADNVRCLYVEGSGCYGRNGHEDAAGDAALIAKTVGRPVRVQWSRADGAAGTRRGRRRSSTCAATDEPAPSRPGIGVLHSAADGGSFVVAAHAGCARHPAAEAGHRAGQASFRTRRSLQVRQCADGLSPPRNDAVPSVLDQDAGADANTYANECFMDELAVAAKADPIEFG